MQGRDLMRVWNDRASECRRLTVKDCEADAIDRHRAFFDQVAAQIWRDLESVEKRVALGLNRFNMTDSVDVAEHQVTGEAVV